MGFNYEAFGLRLRSSLAIPGLQEVPSPYSADVEITVRRSLAGLIRAEDLPVYYTWSGMESDPSKLIIRHGRIGTPYYWIYEDGTEFLIDPIGSHIEACWPPDQFIEDLATYLLGPIMAFVIALRGTPSLHASAVAVGDQAIALVGSSGAGKSTTAAAFASLGYPVLSDDILPLSEENGQIMVGPGYSRLRLWPESARILYGSEDSLPRLTPTWDKRYLDLATDEQQFYPHRLPLAAIYFLGKRQADPLAPLIEPMPHRMALMTLLAHVHDSSLQDRRMRTTEFEILGQLMDQVPIRQVTPHADAAYLTQLCQAILKDFKHV
jgi:hypothetical protein